MPLSRAFSVHHRSLHPLLRIDRERRFPYFSAMAKLDIITLPDPILRKVSAPVERVDAELRKLADDMLETMYAAPGRRPGRRAGGRAAPADRARYGQGRRRRRARS